MSDSDPVGLILSYGPEIVLPDAVVADGLVMVDDAVEPCERKFVAPEPGMNDEQVADYFLAGVTKAEKVAGITELAQNLVLELTLSADKVDENTMRAFVVLIRSKNALDFDDSPADRQASKVINWALSAFCQYNRGLVSKLVWPYANNSGLDIDDLVSIGSMEMLKALGQFDLAAERTNNVSTFTGPYIIGAAKDEIRRYEHSRRKVQADKISIDQPNQEGYVLQLADDIDVAAEVLGGTNGDLQAVLDHLPERKRRMLYMHVVNEIPLATVGEVFGVTESRACKIVNESLDIARRKLGASKI